MLNYQKTYNSKENEKQCYQWRHSNISLQCNSFLHQCFKKEFSKSKNIPFNIQEIVRQSNGRLPVLFFLLSMKNQQTSMQFPKAVMIVPPIFIHRVIFMFFIDTIGESIIKITADKAATHQLDFPNC